MGNELDRILMAVAAIAGLIEQLGALARHGGPGIDPANGRPVVTFNGALTEAAQPQTATVEQIANLHAGLVAAHQELSDAVTAATVPAESAATQQ